MFLQFLFNLFGCLIVFRPIRVYTASRYSVNTARNRNSLPKRYRLLSPLSRLVSCTSKVVKMSLPTLLFRLVEEQGPNHLHDSEGESENAGGSTTEPRLDDAREVLDKGNVGCPVGEIIICEGNNGSIMGLAPFVPAGIRELKVVRVNITLARGSADADHATNACRSFDL